MPKSPQDYWEEVSKELPQVDGLSDTLRLAFYFGVACTLDFITSLANVQDKPAAFKKFDDQLAQQRLVEKAKWDAKKN